MWNREWGGTACELTLLGLQRGLRRPRGSSGAGGEQEQEEGAPGFEGACREAGTWVLTRLGGACRSVLWRMAAKAALRGGLGCLVLFGATP